MYLVATLTFLAAAYLVAPIASSPLHRRDFVKDFLLHEVKTQCTKSTPEQQNFQCFIQFRWEDPNWTNATATPTCEARFSWNSVTNKASEFNNDYEFCWQDTESERQLPIFRHAVIGIDSPGELTMKLLNFVEDITQPPPQNVRGQFADPAPIKLVQIKKTELGMVYEGDKPLPIVITAITM